MEKEKIASLTMKDVLSVYSGIDGRCCCGCAGKHYANPIYQSEAGDKRGYPVKDAECSKGMVKKVLNIIKTNSVEINSPSCLSAVIGKRLYITYLRKEERDAEINHPNRLIGRKEG